MSAEEPRIEIEIRGGMVAAVRTTDAVGAVAYQVVDYDTDAADDDVTHVDGNGDRYTIDGGTTTVEEFVADDAG